MRRPLHAQLSTLLRGRILRGAYSPGQRIESEHRLAEQFGISRNTVRSALAGLLSVAAANAFAAPAEISADRIREDVRVLSSDAFEGRGPGEPAESKTLNYLTAQFKAAGLEPGAPGGGWLQDVSMMRFDRAPLAKVTINTPRGCCQSDRNSSPIDAAIAT